MNPRTLGVVGLACAAVLGSLLGGGLLFFGGAIVQDVIVQPPPRRAGAPVQVNNVPVFNGLFDDLPNMAQGQPVTREELRKARGPVASAAKCTIRGPFTHDNLAVYLIHGPDQGDAPRVMPLQAALEQNLAVVNAFAISIENRADVPIFIHAADIIKGGTQDRVLPNDYLVPVGQHQLPLSVFCVEAGRSGPRVGEISSSFQTSSEQLPGNRLHLAARYRRNQAEVWAGVREVQEALARNLGGSVQSPRSATSLQLTLESDRLQQGVQSFVSAIGNRSVEEPNAIGVAFAMNGRIESAEIYASSGLFLELWPKLLRANAIAALAERPGGAAKVPTAEAVQKFLKACEKGEQCRRTETAHTVTLQQETERAVLFETCDPAHNNVVLHRSYLVK